MSEPPDLPEDETEDFGAMLDAYGGVQSVKIGPGDKVRGTVIHMTRDTVFCQLSASQEAFILKDELIDADGELTVKMGDTIEAFVASMRGGIELRRKLGRDAVDLVVLEKARDNQLPIEGTVTGHNKGGLEVAVAGARGFCPMGQIDIDFIEDATSFVGQTLQFLVKEIKDQGRNVVLSRRALLALEREKKAKALLADLEVGQRRKVVVSRLASFGAFADLGGMEGLIPISELSYGSVESPEQVLRPGDEVEVKVMRIEDDPKRPGQPRIALSLKAVLPDPFVRHADALHDGALIEGRVVRLEKYGAFVELFEGIQGLVHISEMSDRHVRHPRDVVGEGDEVRVRVLSVDPTGRRVALSLREAETAVDLQSINVGSNVEGTVDRVERYGVFVKLRQGGRALLPANETGTPPGTDLARAFPVGEELELQIIAIDDQGRIKVSKTARDQSEERSRVERYNRSQSGGGSGFGTLGDLLAAKQKKK